MNNERCYDNNYYNQGSLFNKMVEESKNKGFNMNIGMVNNANYKYSNILKTNTDNIERISSSPSLDKSIGIGKILLGIVVIGGIGLVANKFVVEPLRDYFEDLYDNVVAPSSTDDRVMPGTCRKLSRREMRDLYKNTTYLTQDQYTIIDG